MTKKSYEMIASVIKLAMQDTSDGATDIVSDLANKLAEKFATDNVAFDEIRFLKACGIKVNL